MCPCEIMGQQWYLRMIGPTDLTMFSESRFEPWVRDAPPGKRHQELRLIRARPIVLSLISPCAELSNRSPIPSAIGRKDTGANATVSPGLSCHMETHALDG